MKEFTLSDGRTAKVRIYHGKFFYDKEKTEERRGTEVRLTIGRSNFKVKALCHPNDNFCRRSGRKTAANKLLARIRDEDLGGGLTQRDRRAIFQAVCPEYAAKAKATRRRRQSQLVTA